MIYWQNCKREDILKAEELFYFAQDHHVVSTMQLLRNIGKHEFTKSRGEIVDLE